MKLEEVELPYDYTENSRGGSVTYIAASVVLSLILFGVHYFFYDLPLWVITAPIALLFGRAVMFLIIRNAVHEALRDAHSDAKLDEHVVAAVKQRSRETLNYDSFTARVREATIREDD